MILYLLFKFWSLLRFWCFSKEVVYVAELEKVHRIHVSQTIISNAHWIWVTLMNQQHSFERYGWDLYEVNYYNYLMGRTSFTSCIQEEHRNLYKNMILCKGHCIINTGVLYVLQKYLANERVHTNTKGFIFLSLWFKFMLLGLFKISTDACQILQN